MVAAQATTARAAADVATMNAQRPDRRVKRLDDNTQTKTYEVFEDQSDSHRDLLLDRICRQ